MRWKSQLIQTQGGEVLIPVRVDIYGFRFRTRGPPLLTANKSHNLKTWCLLVAPHQLINGGLALQWGMIICARRRNSSWLTSARRDSSSNLIDRSPCCELLAHFRENGVEPDWEKTHFSLTWPKGLFVCTDMCLCVHLIEQGGGFLWDPSATRLITTSTHSLLLHLCSVVTQKLHMGQNIHWTLHSILTERQSVFISMLFHHLFYHPSSPSLKKTTAALSSPPSLFCVCFLPSSLSVYITQPVSLSYRARLKSPKNRRICSHTFIFIASSSRRSLWGQRQSQQLPLLPSSVQKCHCWIIWSQWLTAGGLLWAYHVGEDWWDPVLYLYPSYSTCLHWSCSRANCKRKVAPVKAKYNSVLKIFIM